MSKISQNASLEEVRCKLDNSLLFKAPTTASGTIEIKCKRCNKIRVISLPLKAAMVNMVMEAAQALVT